MDGTDDFDHDAVVLIIDDSRDNVDLLDVVLRRAGYTNVTSTMEPREGVSLAHQLSPDVILLDLHMPGLDGFQVLELLAAEAPPHTYLPALILTADIDPEARERALALGAKDFISMPIDTSEVLLRIRNVIETGHLYREKSLLIQETLEKRAAELALKRFADGLQRSNNELQNFTAAASHDLQEPLRKIQAFGDRLKATQRDRMDERGQEYIDRMQDAARRMQVLIEDLLKYASLTADPDTFAPVDLNETLTAVVSDLSSRLEDTGGIIDAGELPTLDADPTQMRQLFQNLLGNALKFRKPNVPPVITIRSSRSRGQRGPDDWTWTVTVSDNGIGFEPRFADRIFGIFQRLHGRDQYEGTGVGLAICSRIVQHHRGTIGVESAPGQGTTFAIVVPEYQQRGELAA